MKSKILALPADSSTIKMGPPRTTSRPLNGESGSAHHNQTNMANANQLQDHYMTMSQRVSHAWDLLKDIPKSIFLSFILDVCKLRPKEEVEEIIKCLDDIAGVTKKHSNENSDNYSTSNIGYSNSRNSAANTRSRDVTVQRELYQVLKDQEYWRNVSHSFDSKTTQRLRSRSKTIDGIPGTSTKTNSQYISTNNTFQSVEQSQQSYVQYKNEVRNEDDSEIKHSITISNTDIDGNKATEEPLRAASSASTLILDAGDEESLESEGTKPNILKPVFAQKVAAHHSVSEFSPNTANVAKETTKRKSSESASENLPKRVKFETTGNSAESNTNDNIGTGESSSGSTNSPLLRPLATAYFDLTSSDSDISCELPAVNITKDGDNIRKVEQRELPAVNITEDEDNIRNVEQRELPAVKITKNNNHIRNVEQKDWECDICFKTFERKNSIYNHRLLHYDLKPMTCELCGDMFYNNNTTLENHEKKVHGGWKCSFIKTQMPSEGTPITREVIKKKEIRKKKSSEEREWDIFKMLSKDLNSK